jgi:predicted metal-dependent phosphotriesterase family hydrolase
MTLSERAEKIIEKGQEISDEGGSSRRMFNWLVSELQAAVDDQIKIGQAFIRASGESLITTARNEALEKAAQAAENTPINTLRSQSHEGLRLSISDAIRALKSENLQSIQK